MIQFFLSYRILISKFIIASYTYFPYNKKNRVKKNALSLNTYFPYIHRLTFLCATRLFVKCEGFKLSFIINIYYLPSYLLYRGLTE